MERDIERLRRVVLVLVMLFNAALVCGAIALGLWLFVDLHGADARTLVIFIPAAFFGATAAAIGARFGWKAAMRDAASREENGQYPD